jgi:hypothetical protein
MPYLNLVPKIVEEDPKFMFFDMFTSDITIECVVMYAKISNNADAPQYLKSTFPERCL